MRRKIVQHGPSSLSMTLPSQWVKKYNIKKGDEVDVQELGVNILVSKVSMGEKILFADISPFTPSLAAAFVVHSYTQGYNLLKITYNNHLVHKAIQEVTHELVGFEITEQNTHGCTLQIVSANFHLDFDTALRKTFFSLKDMISLLEQASKESKQDRLQNFYLKDAEVNRFCNFCLRQINCNHVEQHLETVYGLYHIIVVLEQLGDCLTAIASLQPQKQFSPVLKSLQSQFDSAYNFFYKPTEESAMETQTHYDSITKSCKDFFTQGLTGSTVQIVHLIKDAARDIQECMLCKLSLIDKYSPHE